MAVYEIGDEEGDRIREIKLKILDVLPDYSKDYITNDDTLSALINVFIEIWADACCADHRKHMADCLALDVPGMLKEANMRASERASKRCLH